MTKSSTILLRACIHKKMTLRYLECKATSFEGSATRRKDEEMKTPFKNQQGAIGWILLWVIGIPIPILLALFLIRGCT